MTEIHEIRYKSPIGFLLIQGDEFSIKGIKFLDEEEKDIEQSKKPPPVLLECQRQLKEYFEGSQQEFSVR